MFELKSLSMAGIEKALGKAERYRLLSQPELAESICLDILEVDKGNQQAAIMLILALTDQFGRGSSGKAKRARELALNLQEEYNRLYYVGIILERQGNTALASETPGSRYDAWEWYHEAMEAYEQAERIHPKGNDDAILRWNTCARLVMKHKLEQRPDDDFVPLNE